MLNQDSFFNPFSLLDPECHISGEILKLKTSTWREGRLEEERKGFLSTFFDKKVIK